MHVWNIHDIHGYAIMLRPLPFWSQLFQNVLDADLLPDAPAQLREAVLSLQSDFAVSDSKIAKAARRLAIMFHRSGHGRGLGSAMESVNPSFGFHFPLGSFCFQN